MSTSPSYSRYALFAYPYVSMYPVDGDDPTLKNGVRIPGISNLGFGRSKASPSNSLNLSIVGPVHWALRPGTWVILRSSVFVGGAEDETSPTPVDATTGIVDFEDLDLVQATDGIPRFIGQITTVQTLYSSDGDGRIHRVTSVRVREWSDVLNIAVRFDDYSLLRGLQGSEVISTQALNEFGGGPTLEDQSALALANFNPFEFAQVVLRIVGAMNADQQDNEALKALKYTYPDVSATMPAVPKAMLMDLGIKTADEKSPFTSGFVSVISGVQTGPIEDTQDQFIGLFSAYAMDSLTDDSYFERNPKFRPVSRGKITALFQGVPVWNVITQYIDPAVNEIFTDFIYTYDDVGGKTVVGARPFIFMRDKPFTLKSYFQSAGFLGGDVQWTYYDDLPRISLDTVFIQALTIGNTFSTSPNFIRINYASSEFAAVSAQFQALAASPEPAFKRAEMKRFGGHEQGIETTYISSDLLGQDADISSNDTDVVSFFGSLKKVFEGWYTQLYKFGTASLQLKDPGIPMTVGFNLQFKIGDYVLVGHIESVETTASIDGEGRYSTSTHVELSHLVQVLPSGTLSFIPIDEMFNLVGEAIPFTADQYTKDSNFEVSGQDISDAIGTILGSV